MSFCYTQAMKSLSLLLFCVLLMGAPQDCPSQYQAFVKQEVAYKMVTKINVDSREANAIVNRYIKASNSVLSSCPDMLSLDKQYVLRRELKKLSNPSEKYRVDALYEIRKKALTTREEITVYRNGTIRPVR